MLSCFLQCRRWHLVTCAVLVLAALGGTMVDMQKPPPGWAVPIEEKVIPDEPIDRIAAPAPLPGGAVQEREEEEEETKEEPERKVKLIEWVGLKSMEKFIHSYWAGNLFCEIIDALREADPHVFIRFNITFGCQELFAKSSCGTGNFLGLYYGMRLAAHVYENVEVHFTCHDAEAMRNHLILPWMTGVFPARLPHQPSAFPDLTPRDKWCACHLQPVGHMIPSIQKDLRRMAVALVGRSAVDGAIQTPPLDTTNHPSFLPQLAIDSNGTTAAPFADIELDDAVLHFRCGDLMDSSHSSFAFMNFRGYTRHINPNVKSIGILTQPFTTDSVQARSIDSESHIRDRCRTVVQALVEYIQERFPHARMRIHNTESIALTYARMILAQQAISGISTFGVMPAAATFVT